MLTIHLNDLRTFYGPHECRACGKMIVKASRTEGGEEFDQPSGPIYPNTEWVRHHCQQTMTVVDMPPDATEAAVA